jgi:hypothetical protein
VFSGNSLGPSDSSVIVRVFNDSTRCPETMSKPRVLSHTLMHVLREVLWAFAGSIVG